MSHSVQDRERAVQAITQRTILERRIKRTQRQIVALQGEARQALEAGLLVDQAALAEAIQAAEVLKAEVLEQSQADMREKVERVRRKSEEALRLKAEWRSSQFPNYLSGSNIPPSPGQSLGLIVLLAAMAAIAGGVLLLNR